MGWDERIVLAFGRRQWRIFNTSDGHGIFPTS